MGNTASEERRLNKFEQLKRMYVAVFKRLGLVDKDLNKLHKLFWKIDRDESGSISHKELFEFLGVEVTLFSERVFEVMDLDGDGAIDIIEFIIAVYNYCSFDKEGLAQFAFDLYDLDETGALAYDELLVIMYEVYGESKQNRARLQRLALEATHGGSKNCSRATWLEWVKRHEMLLYPAFHMQRELRKQIMGMSFWHGIEEHRLAAGATHHLHPNNWRHLIRLVEAHIVDGKSPIGSVSFGTEVIHKQDGADADVGYVPLQHRMRRGSANALGSFSGKGALIGAEGDADHTRGVGTLERVHDTMRIMRRGSSDDAVGSQPMRRGGSLRPEPGSDAKADAWDAVEEIPVVPATGLEEPRAGVHDGSDGHAYALAASDGASYHGPHGGHHETGWVDDGRDARPDHARTYPVGGHEQPQRALAPVVESAAGVARSAGSGRAVGVKPRRRGSVRLITKPATVSAPPPHPPPASSAGFDGYRGPKSGPSPAAVHMGRGAGTPTPPGAASRRFEQAQAAASARGAQPRRTAADIDHDERIGYRQRRRASLVKEARSLLDTHMSDD